MNQLYESQLSDMYARSLLGEIPGSRGWNILVASSKNLLGRRKKNCLLAFEFLSAEISRYPGIFHSVESNEILGHKYKCPVNEEIQLELNSRVSRRSEITVRKIDLSISGAGLCWAEFLNECAKHVSIGHQVRH